jgi:glycosyltransferase involved in cell wall biosynthesis
VIATRTGGNPELVLEDHTGFLVPASDPIGLGNAIAKYIEDRALIKRHGDAGRRRVECDFSLDAMVNRYLEVYDSVLGEG